MKKLIDKRIVVINVLLLGLGFLCGILFLAFTSNLDKLIIKDEITEFFSLIESNQSASISQLFISFKYNFMYIFIITATSILYLFSPIIFLVDFYKGFLLGFLVSSVVLTFKIKGILYAILLLFPHHLVWAAVIVLYSSVMLHFSLKLLKGTCKGENINLKTFIQKIGVLFAISLGCALIASLLEVYLSPIIIRSIL